MLFTSKTIRKISAKAKNNDIKSQLYHEIMGHILEDANDGKDRCEIYLEQEIPEKIIWKVRNKLERKGFLVAGNNGKGDSWTILFKK